MIIFDLQALNTDARLLAHFTFQCTSCFLVSVHKVFLSVFFLKKYFSRMDLTMEQFLTQCEKPLGLLNDILVAHGGKAQVERSAATMVYQYIHQQTTDAERAVANERKNDVLLRVINHLKNYILHINRDLISRECCKTASRDPVEHGIFERYHHHCFYFINLHIYRNLFKVWRKGGPPAPPLRGHVKKANARAYPGKISVYARVFVD